MYQSPLYAPAFSVLFCHHNIRGVPRTSGKHISSKYAYGTSHPDQFDTIVAAVVFEANESNSANSAFGADSSSASFSSSFCAPGTFHCGPIARNSLTRNRIIYCDMLNGQKPDISVANFEFADAALRHVAYLAICVSVAAPLAYYLFCIAGTPVFHLLCNILRPRRSVCTASWQ